jgi:hypothetical protein
MRPDPSASVGPSVSSGRRSLDGAEIDFDNALLETPT